MRALYDHVVARHGVSYWNTNIEPLVDEYFCDDEAKRVRFNTLVMAYTADRFMGELKDALVHKTMWDNTLFVSCGFNPYRLTHILTDLHCLCVYRLSLETMEAGHRLVNKLQTGPLEVARTTTWRQACESTRCFLEVTFQPLCVAWCPTG